MCCLHKLVVVFLKWLQKKHCHAPLVTPLVPLDTFPVSHEKCGRFTKQYCFPETHCSQTIAFGHINKTVRDISS